MLGLGSPPLSLSPLSSTAQASDQVLSSKPRIESTHLFFKNENLFCLVCVFVIYVAFCLTQMGHSNVDRCFDGIKQFFEIQLNAENVADYWALKAKD